MAVVFRSDRTAAGRSVGSGGRPAAEAPTGVDPPLQPGHRSARFFITHASTPKVFCTISGLALRNSRDGPAGTWYIAPNSRMRVVSAAVRPRHQAASRCPLLTPLTDLERDALAELSNIAMARAATSLRQMVTDQVLLSVPSVEILTRQDAISRVSNADNPKLVAVRQDFSGPLTGRALLIFPEAGSLSL